MFKSIAILFIAFAVVAYAKPEPKADPKPEPKANLGVVAYSSPVVASYAAYPSAAIVESSYHGNLAYPYAVSAPIVAASPYAYAAAPVFVR